MASGPVYTPNALRQTRPEADTSQQRRQLLQVLESDACSSQAGQPIVFSWLMRRAAGFSGAMVRAEVITGTGRDESAASLAADSWTSQQVVATADFVLGTDFLSLYYTSGVVPVGATQIGVRLSWALGAAPAADDSLDITATFLQPGQDPAPDVPPLPGEEMQRCQRYFETWGFDPDVTPLDGQAEGQSLLAAFTATTLSCNLPFKTVKRRRPDVQLFRGSAPPAAAGRISPYTGSWVQSDASSIPVATQNDLVVQPSRDTEITVGASYLSQLGWTADSEL